MQKQHLGIPHINLKVRIGSTFGRSSNFITNLLVYISQKHTCITITKVHLLTSLNVLGFSFCFSPNATH